MLKSLLLHSQKKKYIRPVIQLLRHWTITFRLLISALRRFQGDGVHLRDHQRGGDARGVQSLRRGPDRDVHVRHHAPETHPLHPELGAQRQGLGMGRLLGQHRLRVQVRQAVRGHGGARSQPAREDEPAQQRSWKSGKCRSIDHGYKYIIRIVIVVVLTGGAPNSELVFENFT